MSEQLKVKMIAGVGIGISAATALYYWYRSKSIQVPPTKWKAVGKLEEVCMYPIKSCGGIELESTKCTVLGIQHGMYTDRLFMLIDEEGKQVTARTYPKMVTILPKIIGNQLMVTAPGMNELDIDIESVADGEMMKANIWDTDVYVTVCGTEYDKWFSRFLLDADCGLKLVFYPYPVPTREIVSKMFKNGIFLKSDTGALQDVSSYMVINQTSVDELNTRLDHKVNARQFRGTFLIKTTTPAYEEDKWKWMKIGDEAVFRCVAPCYRCIFPNINAFTGERDPNGEPGKTLRTYRMCAKSKSPIFGVQMGIRVTGSVKKGDTVYVEDI